MYKRRIAAVICAAMLCGCGSSYQGLDMGAMASAGQKAIQAATISDDYIRQYVSQYVAATDAESVIAPAGSPYAVRLANLTRPFAGSGFNFKVYITQDMNAFAVADGSIRVYSGLMDIMDDNELLGIIGHEIGHVHNKDTKDAFKRALLASALRDGLMGVGGTVGVLSASELGALAEGLSQAQYSQKQEYEADEYGYRFLKQHGINPWAMAMALEKLHAMEQKAGSVRTSGMMQLFSTHPQMENRMERLAKMAAKDGYTRPSGGSPSTSQGTSGEWSF